MAVYEYRCRDCDATFERREPMSEHEGGGHPTCPECGSRKTAQVMSGFYPETSKKS